MKNKKLYSFVLCVVSALLAVVPVTTVLAAEPSVQTFHEEGTFVAADCGNYLALETFAQNTKETTFFDQNGNPVKLQVNATFNGILTNSVTGQTLRDSAHYSVMIDLQTGAEANVGLLYGITVPGEGMAVLDAGKIVFDAGGNLTFEGGPHHFFHEGETLICAALD
jgi:hypothetical protein